LANLPSIESLLGSFDDEDALDALTSRAVEALPPLRRAIAKLDAHGGGYLLLPPRDSAQKHECLKGSPLVVTGEVAEQDIRIKEPSGHRTS